MGTPGNILSSESMLWKQCIRDLQAEIPEQQFKTWIRPLQAVDSEGVLRLLAPNRFVVDWLNQHYLNRIEEIIGGSGSSSQVVVEVGSRQGLGASTPRQTNRPKTAAIVGFLTVTHKKPDTRA